MATDLVALAAVIAVLVAAATFINPVQRFRRPRRQTPAWHYDAGRPPVYEISALPELRLSLECSCASEPDGQKCDYCYSQAILR